MTEVETLAATSEHVLQTEGQALLKLAPKLSPAIAEAAQLLLKTKGRVVVIGMGKSGHIGQKIAATLASLGTPAFFVHPAEAGHGDIGMLTRDDATILISNSGTTRELTDLFPALDRLALPSVAITQSKHSPLGKFASLTIATGNLTEACRMGLAPTTSTTVALAIGDALAVCMQQARKFVSEDYAHVHPLGALGKRLTLTAQHIMRTEDDIPKIHLNDELAKVAFEISTKRLGFGLVTDDNGCLAGIITDGDLRRAIANALPYTTKAFAIMTKDPITVPAQTKLTVVEKILKENKITGFVVVDSAHKPLGAANIHDIWQSGI